MKLFFKSLTFKIGIIIILVEIIVLAVTGFFYINRFSAQVDERVRTRIELPGTLVARGLLNFGSVADEEVMQELVGEGLVDGLVIGADQTVFHSLNPDYVRQRIGQVPGLDPAWFDENATESQLIETADGLVSITPIRAFAEEKSSFFVYIKVGAEQAARERRSITGLFVLGSLFSVILTSIAIIYLFNSTILSGIRSVLDVLGRVAQGDLTARVEGSIPRDEIGVLQNGFNAMAARLEETVGVLERGVAARTRRLEIVATLGERLGAILDVEKLLAEIVNQIKDNFGYYHAHIYLLDEAGETLVVAEGTGPAGAEMKATGHSIPLGAPRSLVARAARTGQIVRVDNVREVADWLPNPLLPDTYAEMAVPIILEEEVVGVLDVQQDRIAGLVGQGDANLLRSVASQVAVALNNARLFKQTQEALAEAEAAHQRYLAQSWDTFRQAQPVLRAEQQKSVVPAAASESLRPIKRQVVQQGKTVIVDPNEVREDDNDHGPPPTLMTPLKLRGEVIGTLGLMDVESGRRWTREEITLVETITEQAALALENARLFKETQQRAARQKIIADVTNQVWASGELEQVMQTAVEQLGATLGATRVVIHLGTEDQLLSKRDDQ